MQHKEENLLSKIQKIYKNVLLEAKNLTFPSYKETIFTTIFILILCGILCLYFIIIGNISIFLLKYMGV